MTDRERILAIALGEVGYQEKETNASLDSFTANSGDENFTKYAREVEKVQKGGSDDPPLLILPAGTPRGRTYPILRR